MIQTPSEAKEQAYQVWQMLLGSSSTRTFGQASLLLHVIAMSNEALYVLLSLSLGLAQKGAQLWSNGHAIVV